MRNSYFVVLKKDGTELHFDKRCNHVEEFSKAGTIISFYQKIKREKILIVHIPVSEIAMIINKLGV